ncbi:MAG: M16 family metallopeptidase [Gammaproteobacteria bacterium]
MPRIIPAALMVAALTALAAGAGDVKFAGATVTLEPYDDAPAASGSSLPKVEIPYQKFVLPNGLTLVVHEDRKAPIVAVNVWYHVGSKDEKPGKTGFAHLFEHLMFQGSENYRDEYFKPFERVGATDMNGTTWLDRTNYFQNVPTTALDMALWMESDRMGHFLGAVDQKLLDEQRGVVQNEKRQGENEPYGKVFEALQRASFPEGHPYRWETIGSMDDLNAASLADVKEWFGKYYGAANVTLVLAGDVDATTAKEKVQKYFGDIPAGPPVTRLSGWTAARSEPTRSSMQDRVAQVRIYKTWNVPRGGTSDVVLLQLGAGVLGGSAASRLDARLVHQDRIADRVSASVLDFELASVFSIDADVKQGVEPARVEAAIEEELARLIKEGPTAAETRRVQTLMAAGFVRGVERIGGFGGKADVLAACQVYEGTPDCYKRDLTVAANATPKTIQGALQRWLAQGDHTLTVSPFPKYATAPSAVERKGGPPVVTQFPDLAFPEIQRGTLKNGMPVILAERHDVPVIHFQMMFDAGYAADQGRKLGTSSFTTGMLDEGTTTRTPLEFAARAEDLGARIGAGSGLDTSTATLSALKARLGESLDLYADMILRPAFDPAEFKRVQGQWLARIAQEKTEPDAMALRVLPPLMYGAGHAYAMPLTGSGTEASIASLTPDDLHAFHKEWLRPDNARLLVVGDTTLAEIVPLLDTRFAAWKPPASALPRKNVTPVAPQPAARVFLVDKPEAEQSMIIAGLPAPSSKASNHLEIQTMNAILGGTFTSRLNMNLREAKHWSYGAGASLPGAVGQRPYYLYAPVQSDKTLESIKEVAREAREYVGKRPATADELAKIKARDVRRLPGQYETSAAVLGALAGIVLYERPDDYVRTLRTRVERQTLPQIQSVAREVLKPDALTWVIVGDLAKIEAPIRKLNLGEVKVIDADGNEVKR